VAKELAQQLADRLPDSDDERNELLKAGQRLVESMGWDQVVEESLLPMLQRICK
jgi:hypothetical protein